MPSNCKPNARHFFKLSDKLSNLAFLSRCALFICILSIVLASNTYSGIWHDAILYSGQAIRLIYPENYSNDLFFLYRSQDSFTLFSNIYAAAIKLEGLENAAKHLSLIGLITWATSLLFLCKNLINTSYCFLSTALVIYTLTPYSPLGTFIAHEPFVTARPFAESACFIGIAALLSQRTAMTFIALSLALLLHPLQSLPVVGIAILIAFWERKLTLFFVALTLLVVVIAFNALNIAPFDGLTTPLDNDWYTISNRRSPWLFIDNWHRSYWEKIVSTILALSLIFVTRNTKHRQLYLVTVSAIIGGILITWLGSKTHSSVLSIQLQTWRVMWFADIITFIGAIELVGQWLKGNKYLGIASLGIITAAFDAFSIAVWVLLICFTYYVTPTRVQRCGQKPLLWTITAFLTLTLLWHAYFELYALAKTLPTTLSHLSHQDISPLLLISSLTLMVVSRKKPATKQYVLTFTIFSTIILLVSLAKWDRRTDFQKANFLDDDTATRLKRIIPANQNVYWPYYLSVVWFELNRSSFTSGSQSSGVIFDRKTAVIARDRHLAILHLHSDETSRNNSLRFSAPLAPEELKRSDLNKACEPNGPDWLVLRKKFSGFEIEFSDKTSTTFYLYRCSHYQTHDKLNAT